MEKAILGVLCLLLGGAVGVLSFVDFKVNTQNIQNAFQQRDMAILNHQKRLVAIEEKLGLVKKEKKK